MQQKVNWEYLSEARQELTALCQRIQPASPMRMPTRPLLFDPFEIAIKNR
jgi:hypothetical protein